MTADPAIGYAKVRNRIEDRLRQVGDELRALSIQPEAVNAETQISLATDDIESGWRQVLTSAESLAAADVAMAHELLLGLELVIDGAFVSGTLLTRDESVARRFTSKAPVLARAARARKNGPLFDKQVQIIKQEIRIVEDQRQNLSLDGLAEWICDAVNKRLQEERLRPLSKTTIWRRIRDFNL